MQEILTYIIVALAFGYVGVKTFQSFRRKPVCEEQCPTCAGCTLKDTCAIARVNTDDLQKT